MKFIIEIPGFSDISGGIQRMIELEKEISKFYPTVLHEYKNPLAISESDFIITFSDRPDIDKLCQQAKENKAQVIVYQLSFGMCLEREKRVVTHPDVIVCCSTLKIREDILDYFRIIDNSKTLYCIDHSQETTLEDFYPEKSLIKRDKRLFDVTIMIHNSLDKQFKEAFDFCKARNLKICLFGPRVNNVDLQGAERVFLYPSKKELRWIFNNSEKYLSFSKTEGLNRVGIEAMLCGCKSYITDGCEIYQHRFNCCTMSTHDDFDIDFDLPDYETLYKLLAKYTWKNTLKNLGDIIGIKF